MSKNQPKGLGKGISALLGEAIAIDKFTKPVGYVNQDINNQTEKQDSLDILTIPMYSIEPNPFQPRMSFDQEALDELADSIKTFGLIQPITVRCLPNGKYQIISGERRYRACQVVGMETIPAYVRTANDQGMLEMAIVENIQRENLDPIEMALSYQRLIEECKLTQEQMAQRVGRKRASITNFLRLLKLPAKVQHDLKVGLLSVGHAKVLLSIDNPQEQEILCDFVIKHGLSVRQLEDKIHTLQNRKQPYKEEQSLPEPYYKVLEHIGKYFNQDISLKRSSSGKGTMTIKFESDEEIQRFLQALDNSNL